MRDHAVSGTDSQERTGPIGVSAQVASLVLISLIPWPAVATGAPPVAVSPGSAAHIQTIGTRCPTFSWSGHPETESTALSIWPVDAKGDVDDEARRRVQIPGDARSWTPTGAECLEGGKTYAWNVESGGEWSEPLFLRVAGGVWLDELLEDLVFELVAYRRLVAARAGGQPSAESSITREGVSSGNFTLGTATVNLDNNNFYALWAEGQSRGIFASATESDGRAVFGTVTGGTASSSIAGVTGITDSPSVSSAGVRGTGETHGIQGIAHSTAGIGIQGIHSGTTSPGGCGVEGRANSPTGFGLWGEAPSPTGTTYAVYGASSSASGFDFYAAGGNGTTDYGPFTGAHEVRLLGELEAIRPGMVVSVTGRTELRIGPAGINLSSTLPTVRLANRAHDAAVFGAFVSEMELPPDHWLEDRSGRFGIVNALGEGRVWVTDINGPVQTGDYLTTSQIAGYAQRQGETGHHAYTLGKATESLDWEQVTETVNHDGRVYRAALIAVVYTSG